ncbi:S8 family peptidase [Spirosoma foliorum]|uniref:S8 family peptidase n=1 Tax=Spirosoma foliorum TaxID=2710596 RepID=A0A7G5GWH3_9BACT|nr:S8 family peptidase [Spirosoma foliorum]QMW03215.1 S8 family peptidase [Spirosoma foliorum]
MYPHLIYTNPPQVDKFSQPNRVPGEKPKDTDQPNYAPMQQDFSASLAKFNLDRARRAEGRTLPVPAHIDYIRIRFFSVFDNAKFESRYRSNFGLVPVLSDEFNQRILFAIANDDRFQNFLNEILNFINADQHEKDQRQYNSDLLFIKGFELLTSPDILPSIDIPSDVILNLVDSHLDITSIRESINGALASYLESNEIRYEFVDGNSTIQLWDVTSAELTEVVNNFDVITSVRPNAFGVISPDRYGIASRSFGFQPVLPDNEIPIIGIIDTGISDQTPLAELIMNPRENDPYDLTRTNARIDNWDNTWGHGTGVAGIAAFGHKLHSRVSGQVQADARLLSIKALSPRNPRVSDNAISEAIRRANKELDVRIFVLTISENIKDDNEPISALAYELDLLAYELNILICIASGNMRRNMIDALGQMLPYPKHFSDAENNIHSPAESMNNLTVGAIADNLEANLFVAGIANDKTAPAIYSSKFHINLDSATLTQNQANKQLVKPDILYYGGDHEITGDKSRTGISVLTPKIGQYFVRETGTSYAAPFVANLAARILGEYPRLSMQTVKAIIVNSATVPKLDETFTPVSKSVLNNVLGKGIPSEPICLKSTDHEATIILEDGILPGQIQTYSLKLPDYLLISKKATGLLEFQLTLCFKFKPIQHSQSTYCPIHIGFGVFRNAELSQIASGKLDDQYDKETNERTSKGHRLRTGWSQDPYYRGKLLCNTQKTSFIVGKKELIDEQNTFVIVLSSQFSKLLTETQKAEYAQENEFTIAIRVHERPAKGEYIDSLYEGIRLVNNLSTLIELDADLEAEATAE